MSTGPNAEGAQAVRRECASCELRSLRMFCNLDDAALEEFGTMGRQESLPSGTTLFAEGVRGGDVVMLCTGQAKLFCTSREGRRLILKIAMPGDVLGLGAAVSGERFEVTAETVGPAEIKRIPREAFLAFLGRHGQASLHAARVMTGEYKAAFFDARRLALSGSAGARLAGLLLEWARAASCGKAELKFTLALTHEDVADMVGSSRETVTRLLTRFRREGLIEQRGATVRLLDAARLEAMAV